MLPTKAQQRALKALYDRHQPRPVNDIPISYLAFRRTAYQAFGDCLMVYWCGMFIGIESDGYTHS